MVVQADTAKLYQHTFAGGDRARDTLAAINNQLHVSVPRRQIEAAELHKHTRQEVAAAFAAALAGARLLPTAAAAGDVKPELQQQAAALIAGLQASAPTLACAWDATLPVDPGR